MKYGTSPDGDFTMFASVVGGAIAYQWSPNAAAALRDALAVFFAEREVAIPADEPTTIVGDS